MGSCSTCTERTSAPTRTYDEVMSQHPLAQHRQLVAADARDALEEGLLPRLQLDQLHAFQRLGGGVDAVVLHLHQLTLNARQLLRDEPCDRNHENHHHHACHRCWAELGVSMGAHRHLAPEQDQ